MPGETLNAPAMSRSVPSVARTLPRCLLYSIFARIGGYGLDTDAFETLRASYRGGFLGNCEFETRISRVIGFEAD